MGREIRVDEREQDLKLFNRFIRIEIKVLSLATARTCSQLVSARATGPAAVGSWRRFGVRSLHSTPASLAHALYSLTVYAH